MYAEQALAVVKYEIAATFAQLIMALHAPYQAY